MTAPRCEFDLRSGRYVFTPTPAAPTAASARAAISTWAAWYRAEADRPGREARPFIAPKFAGVELLALEDPPRRATQTPVSTATRRPDPAPAARRTASAADTMARAVAFLDGKSACHPTLAADRGKAWRVALHEGAHALAAIVLGGSVERLVVSASGGRCDARLPSDAAKLLHALAGEAGLRAAHAAESHPGMSDAGDRACAAEIAARIAAATGARAAVVLAQARTDVEALFASSKSVAAVRALALALVARGELDGDEAEAIVRQALDEATS